MKVRILAADDSWFYDLSKEKQRKYVEEHPKSKFAQHWRSGHHDKHQLEHHKTQRDKHGKLSDDHYKKAEEYYRKTGGDAKALKNASENGWYSVIEKHLKKAKSAKGLDHYHRGNEHFELWEHHDTQHSKLKGKVTPAGVSVKAGKNWAAHAKIEDAEHHRRQEKHHNIAIAHLKKKIEGVIPKTAKAKQEHAEVQAQIDLRKKWAARHNKRFNELGGELPKQDTHEDKPISKLDKASALKALRETKARLADAKKKLKASPGSTKAHAEYQTIARKLVYLYGVAGLNVKVETNPMKVV